MFLCVLCPTYRSPGMQKEWFEKPRTASKTRSNDLAGPALRSTKKKRTHKNVGGSKTGGVGAHERIYTRCVTDKPARKSGRPPPWWLNGPTEPRSGCRDRRCAWCARFFQSEPNWSGCFRPCRVFPLHPSASEFPLWSHHCWRAGNPQSTGLP